MQATITHAAVRAAPAASSRAAAVPARERARRRLVAVVLLIYLLLIFEGALRKWAFPQASLYLFFVRDPFVLYAYFLATVHGLWPKRSYWLTAIVVVAALGVLICALQLMIDHSGQSNRLVLAAYGWRNYFLYAPLAFLVGAQFRAKDLARVARWTLLLSVPMAVLVTAQFAAPPNAAINVGTGSDRALQFVGLVQTAEHTRPMGTFSSQQGQVQFVASGVALFFALIFLPARNRPVGRWVLVLAAGGLATLLALSGSRTTVLHCGLIAVAGMALVLVGRGAALKFRSLALPIALAAAFAVLYPIVFQEGFEAFSQRWETAAKTENKIFQGGVYGRALYGFVDFMRLFGETPVLGYGVGLGGNASTTLGVDINGVDPLALAETDWARHILELGSIFGSAYIVLRIVLAAWLGVLVLRATRRGSGALPLLLYAYVSYLLLLGQITGQGAVNGYAWLFMGFCIAAANEQLRGKGSASDGAPPPPATAAPVRGRALVTTRGFTRTGSRAS